MEIIEFNSEGEAALVDAGEAVVEAVENFEVIGNLFSQSESTSEAELLPIRVTPCAFAAGRSGKEAKPSRH